MPTSITGSAPGANLTAKRRLRSNLHSPAMLVLLLLCAGTTIASAQGAPAIAAGAGSEVDRFLRMVELARAGQPTAPWSIRDGNPALAVARTHETSAPWSELAGLLAPRFDSARFIVLPARVGSVINTGFPYGWNDGPLWAGRGVTTEMSAGVAARAGPFTLALRPHGFASQNAAIPLTTGLVSSEAPFANGPFGARIDLPQRFGSGAYARVGLGESFLRFDSRWIAVGVSNESQIWGPASEYPLVLGNNAGGFPHLFAGTAMPVRAGPVTLAGKIIWGELRASGYSTSPRASSFATGAVGVLGFRSIPGLELGAIRFFHTRWPERGLAGWPFLKVFEGILKESLASGSNPTGDTPGDNQLASVFMRWAFPSAHVEIYGEFGREDHSWSLRDFFLEPDHNAAWMAGLQRVWGAPGLDRATALRIEHLNSRISPLQLARGQAPWYVHGILVNGHTHRGQVLGAEGALGGGATTVAIDRYHAGGRLTVRWDRHMRAEAIGLGGVPDPLKADVVHAIGIDGVGLGSRRLLVNWGGRAVVDFNRDFHRDAFNLNLTAGVTYLR